MNLRAYDLLEDGRDIVILEFMDQPGEDDVVVIVANNTGHLSLRGLDDIRLLPSQVGGLGMTLGEGKRSRRKASGRFLQQSMVKQKEVGK